MPHGRQPGQACHRRGNHPRQRERHKVPRCIDGESVLKTGYAVDGRQELRLGGKPKNVFRHETEKPHHAQGAKELQADGTGESRKQGHKQSALHCGKDFWLDAQMVRCRNSKVCGAGQDARTAHHRGNRLQLVPNPRDYYVQLYRISGKYG